MVELQMFEDVEQRPSAGESAMLDWVVGEARREYGGTCPFQWYDALLRAAARLANPKWRDLNDFPKPLPAVLSDAHRAMFRSIEANTVLDMTTAELQRARGAIARRRRPENEESYEDVVARVFIDEVLREREILECMALPTAA